MYTVAHAHGNLRPVIFAALQKPVARVEPSSNRRVLWSMEPQMPLPDVVRHVSSCGQQFRKHGIAEVDALWYA